MANKQIKGLTVEIGGDTTKLGKALEAVEKKSRDLSSELGEINKLLKFDPGNADLLAQKQKVLAEAVENTSKKLDTLKEAEAQVQKQFERGEVSEEQVRALQREILATTKKLNSYEKAAQETADSIDKLGKGSADAKEGAEDVSKSSKKADKALDNLADSADKAGKAGEGMGSKMAGAAKAGIGALAAGATAAIGALVGSAEATREYRGEMGKLDAAFTSSGHSSETATAAYKVLQGVIGETDQSVEAAQQIALLADSEEDVAKWAGLASGVVGKFGDALQPETFFEAANETLKLGEATGAYTQMLEGVGMNVEEFNAGLAACSTEAEKQAYMLEITEQALGEAGKAYEKNNAEVIRANQANEAWTATMAEAGAAVEPILTDVKLLGASLLSDLMPGITGVTDAFRGLLNGDAGAAGALGEALSGVISQLLTKITETLPVVAETAISLLSTLTTTLISMTPQLAQTGLQVIMAILQGLTSAIPLVAAELSSMVPRLAATLQAGIPQLLSGAVQLFLAILSAVDQIIEPLVASIPGLVLALINGLLSAAPQLLTGAVQFLSSIISAIPVLLEQLLPQIPLIVSSLVDGLISNIPVLLSGAILLLHALVDAIGPTIEVLAVQIPVIVETITSKLSEMAPVLLSAAVTLLWEIIKAIPQIVVAIGKNAPKILKAIQSVLGALPSLLWKILLQVLGKVGDWIDRMVSKAGEAGSKFINKVVEFFKGLPGKICTWLSNTISKVATWGRDLAAKGTQAAKNLISAVVNKVKELPGKMISAGKDLVSGLWKGINGAYTWLKDKIKGWVGNVTNFLMKLFGINSPSKVTTWMGEMLDEGLAEGVEDNSDKPIKALGHLADDMLGESGELNGLTLERRLNQTAGPDPATAQASGMLAKLDLIYKAILAGQVIMLDGKTLVGSTADRYDSELGQRRVLAERGAI